MKAIAIAAIHLGPKAGKMSPDGKSVVRQPVIEVVPPGQEFEADDKEVKNLIEVGAARGVAKADSKS